MAAIKMSAPVGAGTGVQKFSIKPGGVGLQLDSAAPVVPPSVPDSQPDPPAALPPEPVTPATPFSRLYPGVDPSQVEMVFDDKTRRMRVVPIAPPPEVPVEAPAAPASPAVPAAPISAAPDSVAELKAQLAEQTQLMTAMIQASLTGRPLAEVLSGTPAVTPEPDYSDLDLMDDRQRAQFVKQIRDDMRAEMKAEFQAQMRGVMPQVQSAGRHGEFFEIQAAHGTEPDFQQKAALANQLIGNNPNVSFKATYDLISQIQKGLGGTNGAKVEAPKEPGQGVLTKEQADAKAAQAAKYPASNGSRAVGKREPPPEVARNFKLLAKWVAYEQALGNM